MLLDSKEILSIESRFSSLFQRTLFKGISGKKPQDYKDSVSKWFNSKTFEKQIDAIIDDTYLFTVDYTDKQIKKALKASSQRNHTWNFLSASDDTPLPITEEAVKQADGLSSDIVDSIIKILKDEALYEESIPVLANIVKDIWGGEQYKATRFVRTFTADVATNSAVSRYQQHEVDMQFYARIDSRTSPQCRALHGTIFKFDSPEISLYSPPLHHSCRSSIIPVPVTMDYDKSMLFENRDFTKQMNQDFSESENTTNKNEVTKIFKDIKKFNDKYRIDQFILDADVEKRLAKLGIKTSI